MYNYPSFRVLTKPSWIELKKVTKSHFNIRKKQKPSLDQMAAVWRHQCTNYESCSPDGDRRDKADKLFAKIYEYHLLPSYTPTRFWD